VEAGPTVPEPTVLDDAEELPTVEGEVTVGGAVPVDAESGDEVPQPPIAMAAAVTAARVMRRRVKAPESATITRLDSRHASLVPDAARPVVATTELRSGERIR